MRDREKSGKGDRFIFPDQAEYKDEITNLLATPLELDVKLYGPEGESYSIEHQ